MPGFLPGIFLNLLLPRLLVPLLNTFVSPTSGCWWIESTSVRRNPSLVRVVKLATKEKWVYLLQQQMHWKEVGKANSILKSNGLCLIY